MNKANEKLTFSPHRQYHKNITKLIEISQMIDQENKYSNEVNPGFFQSLFKDLRHGEKWYNNQQWRPIKTAIHNCYKLIQKGYVADNQRELEGNILILEKLVKEPNPKKAQLEKLSAQVVQNIFDNTIKAIRDKAQTQEDIRKSFDDMPIIIQDEYKEFEKMNNSIGLSNKVYIEDKDIGNVNSKYDTKVIRCNCNCDRKLKDQKEFYEAKLKQVENKMNTMEIEINKMNYIIKRIGNVFLDYNKD